MGGGGTLSFGRGTSSVEGVVGLRVDGSTSPGTSSLPYSVLRDCGSAVTVVRTGRVARKRFESD